MTLADWISAEGISDAECARRLDVTRQALSRYLSHLRFPHPDVLRRIHNLTSGKVTANDFVLPHSAQAGTLRHGKSIARVSQVAAR